MHKYRVKVLLSSYNGEKYIDKQINSILNQKDIDVRILIRDDGSKDNTRNILSKYAENSHIEVVYGENIGFKKSFSALVRLAANDNTAFDYYAFADQDDLWYSDKLFAECQQLDKFDKKKPNITTCNSNIIDERDEPSRLFRDFDPLYTNYNVYFSTDFQGCSMVFNRSALEKYNQYPPDEHCHDNWMFLTCAVLGNVTHINKPLFGYRIHSDNAIGIKYESSIFARIKKSLRYWFSSRNIARRKIVQLLYNYWYNEIDEDRRRYIYHYLVYRKNLYSKIWLMANPKSFRMSDGSYKPLKLWRNLLFNKF